MPYYDFVCLECHKRFDIFLSYSDYGQKPVSCPKCAKSLGYTSEDGVFRLHGKIWLLKQKAVFVVCCGCKAEVDVTFSIRRFLTYSELTE